MNIIHDTCIIDMKEPELTIVQECNPYSEVGIQRLGVGSSNLSNRFQRKKCNKKILFLIRFQHGNISINADHLFRCKKVSVQRMITPSMFMGIIHLTK